MKKNIHFTLVFYILLLFLSTTSCHNCEPYPNKFKITALHFEALKIENTGNAFLFTPFKNTAVLYNQFCIKINAETKNYYGNNILPFFNIINKTYACSPAPPTTNQQITAIKIIPNKDFNADNKKGSNIAHLFDVLITDFSENHYKKLNLKEYLNTTPYATNQLVLILKDKPESNKKIQFTVEYYQTGTDVNFYSFLTPEIEIQP